MPSVYNNLLVFRYDIAKRGFGELPHPMQINSTGDVTVVIGAGPSYINEWHASVK